MKLLFFLLFFFKIGHSLEQNNNVSSVQILPKNGIYFFDNNYFIGLKINLRDEWKTYWKNPGDAGLPLNIEFISPNKIEDYEVLFPFPNKYDDHGLKTIGYEKEVIFPVKINFKDNTNLVTTKLKISYLVCEKICIPENKTVSINVDLGKASNNFESSETFQYFNNVPILKKEPLILEFHKSIDDRVSYAVKNSLTEDIFEGYISKSNNENIDYQYSLDDNKLYFSFFSQDIIDDNYDNIFLSYKNGTNYEEVRLNFINTSNKSIIFYIIFALIGGLILNFMPCVLPVLSLKLYSLSRFREVLNTKKFSFYTTINILGIFSSFLLIALLVIILKKLGHDVGWGFQFQNFYFVLLISIFIFIFCLNLLGIFELILPEKINNKIVSLISKEDLRSNFLSGVFSTLLATPCTAPFLGTAVGFAMMTSELEVIYIFFSIAFGFSIPYFLLLIFPKVLNIFPKSGKWMDNFKFLMGIFLLLTFCWLANVMGFDLNLIFVFASLILITCILTQSGHFKTIMSSFVVGCFLIFSMNTTMNQKEDWIKFTPKTLDELVNDNYIVFVDITADWCVTCQVNKFNTLESKIIQETFIRNDVKLLRADWTNKDDRILAYMSSFGKFGVPLNIIYGPKEKNGKILPEILSKNGIINSIDELK